jgi:glucose-1-phosphate thymidylyltransferase
VLETLVSKIDGKVDEASTIEGNVVIEPGGEVVNSRIRGPAIIGERTRVVNSYIGPFTSVAADCEVVDSELDHSVVLSGSRILGIDKLTDSLVGRQVEVVRTDRRPHALRLMLGDHSKVELE